MGACSGTKTKGRRIVAEWHVTEYLRGGMVMIPGLYAGTILKVDLSTGEIARLRTSSYADSFLGGRGINIKLFWDHITPGVDALSPGNILVLGVGPLGGTTISHASSETRA